MTAAILAFTFSEAGVYRMRLTYNEPQHTPGKTSADADDVEARFVTLVPNGRIEQAVTFESDDTAFSAEMRIAWILESAENGTLVTVQCENVPDGKEPNDHQAGLKSTLSKLATFTEIGK